MSSCSDQVSRLTAPVVVFVACSLFAAGQQVTPASPSAESIVEQMMTAKSRQVRQLQSFDVVRNYKIDYHGFGGERHAEMQVVSSYSSPNKKNFRVISQSGSRFLLDHILNKLLDSERDYQLDEADSDLTPHNYEFKLLGMDRVADTPAFVMEITPRRKAKYLCHGKIWVSARDFGILRLEGAPAKNPSFWISHTEMANTYQKVGDFWLPIHKDATTDVRLGGKAVLAIDYSGYRITQNPRPSLEASTWSVFGVPRRDRAPENQR